MQRNRISRSYRYVQFTAYLIVKWQQEKKKKVLEIIICKQIVAFLMSKGHLNPTQHGFRGRSCLSALLNVFDDIMHLMSGGNSVDMVYLDFAKAFDKTRLITDHLVC